MTRPTERKSAKPAGQRSKIKTTTPKFSPVRICNRTLENVVDISDHRYLTRSLDSLVGTCTNKSIRRGQFKLELRFDAYNFCITLKWDINRKTYS